MEDQTQTQEPQGSKRFGAMRLTCLAAQKQNQSNKQNSFTALKFCHTRFFPPHFVPSNRSEDRKKKLILCNIDFLDIQLTHHAKDLDCFFSFSHDP